VLLAKVCDATVDHSGLTIRVLLLAFGHPPTRLDTGRYYSMRYFIHLHSIRGFQ